MEFKKAKPYQNNNKIPTTVDECIQEMLSWNNGIDEFKRKNESVAVTSTHHSVGKWVRNEWGLWSGSKLKDYFVNLGVDHPDHMSGIIVLSFHRYLNGKPIELEKQIEDYKSIAL